MPKFTVSAPSARLAYTPPALLAAALVAVAGCSSDSGPTFPSNAPVQDVLIQKVPQSAPFLMIEVYGDELRLLGVPVDAENRWVDAPVTWESSRPSLAVVETQTGADGRTYGVMKFAASPSYANPTHVDTVSVTASSSGRTGTIEVVVRENPRVETVGLSVPRIGPLVLPGQSFTVTATALDGFGSAMPPPNPWQWASTNTGVAAVTDHGDGTATVDLADTGAASVSAAVLNAGEPAETGTISDGFPVSVPDVPVLTSGQPFDVPTIDDGGRSGFFLIHVPAGSSTLVVQTSDTSDGDADLYLFFGPHLLPNTEVGPNSNAVCVPWAIGSVETCEIDNPSPGTWGIQIHAWPGDGDVEDLQITATVS